MNSKSVQRGYKDLLKQAGVKYRGPNQTRHSFASMQITNFVNLDIVASLLGHSSIKMLQKHYGKIIPSDRPNEAKIISKILGLEYTYDSK